MKYFLKNPYAAVLFLIFLFVLAPKVSHSNESNIEDDVAEDIRQCINLHQVRDIQILDSRNIIFDISHGKYYRSNLPHRCSALKKNSTLVFTENTDRICNVDIVKVVRNSSDGLMQSSSCGLGKFELMTEEQVKLLKEEIKKNKKQKKQSQG